MSANADVAMLEVSKVTSPEEVRARERLSMEAVTEYASLLEDGEDLPPITVFRVGKACVVVDGWHRLAAHKAAKRKFIPAVVKEGSLRDAQLAAAASNARRGVKRTQADCRRAVWLVLQGPEGKQWPVSRIAAHCGVSQTMVRAMLRAAAWAPAKGPAAEEELLAKGPNAVTGQQRGGAESAWGRGEPAPLARAEAAAAAAAPARGATLPAPGPAPAPGDDDAEGDARDRAVLDARIARLLRKFCRYCTAKGTTMEDELRAFRQAQEAAQAGAGGPAGVVQP